MYNGILLYTKYKGVPMEQATTIKVRKATTELLKTIAAQRGRRESMEQVILELVERYLRNETK
jgi:hypothetical protein